MNFIKKLDNELLKKLGIIIGVMLIIIIGFLIFAIIAGGKLTYSQMENRILNSAKKYYKENEKELPQNNNETASISTDKLVENKYLKDLTKLSKTKETCTGNVTVTKNDDAYFYSVTLSCGDSYQTKKLKDVIASNVVESGDGLYKYNDTFVFRGEKVNNYVSFAGLTWRVLRINSDGSIRMIETTKKQTTPWDDRYNSDKEYAIGINDYSVSRIKEYIDNAYNEFKDSDKAFTIKQDLCVGKRSKTDINNDGTIECYNTINGQNAGLIQINEFALASISNKCANPLDPDCTNYNYLANVGSLWTITAEKETSYRAFRFSGSASVTNTSNYYQARMVVHINSQVNYASGDGSEEKPYTFK